MSRGAGSRRQQRDRREAQLRAADELALTCPNLVLSRTAADELRTRAQKARGWIAPDGTWRPHEPGAGKKLAAPKRKGRPTKSLRSTRRR